MDMVHYEGAAFVRLTPDGDSAQITISDGQISPKLIKGEMKDPIGTSRITGSIFAIRNDTRVRELLRGLQDRAAGNDRQWMDAEADTNPVFGK